MKCIAKLDYPCTGAIYEKEIDGHMYLIAANIHGLCGICPKEIDNRKISYE